MAISMVRKPSETPNITNIDDIIPFRYAYGNQSGYVINRGAEVSHTVNGNQFTINSGRLVIQGVESDIDANGITLTIDSVSETRYYSVYNEVNLATNTSTIKMQFDSITYPNIESGDDLTANSIGVARLELYRFIATNGIISDVEKIVKSIKYLKEFVKEIEVDKSIESKTLNKYLHSIFVRDVQATAGESVISWYFTMPTFVSNIDKPFNEDDIRNYLKNNKFSYNSETSIKLQNFYPALGYIFENGKGYNIMGIARNETYPDVKIYLKCIEVGTNIVSGLEIIL